MIAIAAKHEHDELAAKLTPLELDAHELAAMLRMQRDYDAGESVFPVTPSNTEALDELLHAMRARVDRLRESE